MKITVVGTGYVGLISGACFADMGNDVLCLDVDPAKIKILEDSGISIYQVWRKTPGIHAGDISQVVR